MSSDLTGPESHTYFSQRLRLHYVDWGNRDAPPLLMVHGGRDHCRNWDWAAEALREDWHIIAPDLRGHGDSEWVIGGNYGVSEYVYDIAQLVHQKQMAPVTIIAHSLGGMISLQYAGAFPEQVRKMVVIEGLGPSPKMLQERMSKGVARRLADYVEQLREMSGRQSRRYPTLEDAFRRMHEENAHLSPAQARHLTVHGSSQNEDGTWSWKFDNYVRNWPAWGFTPEELGEIWSRITCPVLHLRGSESWASDPREDGRAAHFANAEYAEMEGCGHWLHHDRLDEFLRLTREFLGRP